MRSVDLSIITVGYRSQKTLPALLNSIIGQVACSVEFIYIENASENSSVAMVKEHYIEAIIIEPGENLGFSKACNLGAKAAKGEYLLFLNPDCEIKTVDTLYNMIQFLRTNSKVGVSTSRLINVRGEKIKNCHTEYIHHKYFLDGVNRLPGEIAWVVGAVLMISTTLFKKINGFDERYFMYGEDLDLCLTVRRAGFIIAEVAPTQIMHIGGVSSKQRWDNLELEFRLIRIHAIFTAKNCLPKQHKLIWRRHCCRSIRKFLRCFILAPSKIGVNWKRVKNAMTLYWSLSKINCNAAGA